MKNVRVRVRVRVSLLSDPVFCLLFERGVPLLNALAASPQSHTAYR